jgi:acetyl-CoA C-acetyltransferase
MAVIVAAKRSAIVPRGGAFAALEIEDIAAPVITVLQGGLSVRVDEVICANALGAGGNVARIIALAAGLPHVAGLTIDRQCTGGLDAILLAKAMVDSGAARVVIAGGAESYSRRPGRLRDGVAYDQARFVPKGWDDPDMTHAAASLAREMGISRAAQDDYAVQSHAKYRVVAGEIVPIAGIARDPFARDLTPALAARAAPICGTITPANAAVAADGAAFVLVLGDDLAHDLGRGGLRILRGANIGGDPMRPGLGARAALQAVGGEIADLAEVMEAYAIQAMACIAGLGRVNIGGVNIGGGALARGHAIGASGAVLAVRLFYELQQGQSGVAAIAGAGGIGAAMLVQRAV